MSKQLALTVAAGFNNQPALLAPNYAAVLVDSLRYLEAVKDDQAEQYARAAIRNTLSTFGFSGGNDKPFAFAGGVAIIPVSGLLVNRFNYSYGWVTGYNAIRAQMNAALEDEDVKHIVFDCNTGGGQVAGCFELCDDIFASRSIKPSTAIVDAHAYSAGYAIASSASRVVVTPSGGAGSIGVVAMHVDYSQMLEADGIKVTFIYSGDHKVDGNPYQSLPSEVRADIQQSVDTIRKEFVALVVRNRGLDPKAVFDTQARCYDAGDALRLGLVDAVMPPHGAARALFDELSRSLTGMETDTMSTSAAKPGAESTVTDTPETEKSASQSTVDAKAERTAERARIKAITTSDAAKDKSALANHLALDTDLSVDAAAAILAAAAPETKPAENKGASAFTAAMDADKHPEVGADAGATEMTAAQQILAAQAAATGVKH